MAQIEKRHPDQRVTVPIYYAIDIRHPGEVVLRSPEMATAVLQSLPGGRHGGEIIAVRGTS